MDILFVSKYNMIRSKLAEAYFNKHNKLKQLSAQSAGVFRGGPTPTEVMEAARSHHLSLKTSQSGLSTHTLDKHDVVILVSNDVPTFLFTKDNPYVKNFVVWNVALPDEPTDERAFEAMMKDIERRIKALLEQLGQETKTMEVLDRVLFDLRRLHDPAMVSEWVRMGHPGKKFYGVEVPKLKAMAKRYAPDRTLARGLWKTGIHDARILAAMIEDPAAVTEHQIETWLRQADFWDITDRIALDILPHTTYGIEKMKTWAREQNPWHRRTAWVLLGKVAKSQDEVSDKVFERMLDMIPKMIHKEDRWVAEAMLQAIVAVGRRNQRLYQKALRVAGKVSDVTIDYGDPRIPTPNPLERLKTITPPTE